MMKKKLAFIIMLVCFAVANSSIKSRTLAYFTVANLTALKAQQATVEETKGLLETLNKKMGEAAKKARKKIKLAKKEMKGLRQHWIKALKNLIKNNGEQQRKLQKEISKTKGMSKQMHQQQLEASKKQVKSMRSLVGFLMIAEAEPLSSEIEKNEEVLRLKLLLLGKATGRNKQILQGQVENLKVKLLAMKQQLSKMKKEAEKLDKKMKEAELKEAKKK